MVVFAVLTDHGIKLKESEKKDKLPDFTKELKNSVEANNDSYTNYHGCSCYSLWRTCTRPGGLGNERRSGDNLNHNFIRIGQNTEKSPRDLRWLVVTQTPEKDPQITLMGKTVKEWNNNHPNKWYIHNPESILVNGTHKLKWNFGM